jgi:NAD(P)-dependent dehydrogenase (short-subunit alcohol dehydrogenase family)
VAKTVLITGASSGIGRATAFLFMQRGWNVAATMRDPDRAGDLALGPAVIVPRLDVLDRASIDAAVASTAERFGSIDVLVNNAGYAVLGPLEAIPPANVERQFATNVLGPIATTRAVLPRFRAQGHGLVVNVSSVVGRMTLPLGSVYGATKFAVEGLSEALRFELEAIGARVKLVEPGLVATDFGTRSMEFHAGAELGAYGSVVMALGQAARRMAADSEDPTVVAETIWRAATDGSPQLRYPAGETAARMLAERAELGDEELHARTRERFGL